MKRARHLGWGWLVAYVLLSYGAAALGGWLTGRSVETWYPTLHKPSWTPPSWVFGPVWTVLYGGMAVAAWLTHCRADRPGAVGQRRAALAAWGVQLTLNVAWSGVFFGARQPGGGVAVIAALWASIAACVALMARVSRPAAPASRRKQVEMPP